MQLTAQAAQQLIIEGLAKKAEAIVPPVATIGKYKMYEGEKSLFVSDGKGRANLFPSVTVKQAATMREDGFKEVIKKSPAWKKRHGKAECRMMKNRPFSVPLSFPNLNLIVAYSEALYYAQNRLGMLGSGDLKPFCEKQQLPYTSVVGLKNGKLKRDEPRLLLRLLRGLNMPADLIRYPPTSQRESFLLPNDASKAAFDSQMAYFKSCEM